MSKSYYELLKISPSATFEEIGKAYKKLALIHHPDKAHANPTSNLQQWEEV